MKTKLFTLFIAFFTSAAISAQCFVQVSNTPTTCPNTCDGTANSFPVGTGPFAFLWSPGGMTTQNVTGLCMGSYTITITDANGCFASATTMINTSSTLSAVTTAQPSTSCSPCNGNAAVSASGGPAPFTYSWAPSG